MNRQTTAAEIPLEVQKALKNASDTPRKILLDVIYEECIALEAKVKLYWRSKTVESQNKNKSKIDAIETTIFLLIKEYVSRFGWDDAVETRHNLYKYVKITRPFISNDVKQAKVAKQAMEESISSSSSKEPEEESLDDTEPFSDDSM